MTTEQLAAAWADLRAWWKKNKAMYNAPGIASRAGITKNRLYAALDTGGQGGGTAKPTEALYLQITDALAFRYYRPDQKAGGKPTPPQLRQEYAANSLATLAEWYDVPTATVRGWLTDYGIALRSRGTKPTTTN